MGESQKQAFQLSFNRFLRVAFQGSRVTMNAGAIIDQGAPRKRRFLAVQN